MLHTNYNKYNYCFFSSFITCGFCILIKILIYLIFQVQRDYSEAVRILESKISVLKTENNQLMAKNDFMKNELEQVTNQMALITEQSLSVSNLLKEVTTKEQDWKSRYLLLEAQYIELEKSYQAGKNYYLFNINKLLRNHILTEPVKMRCFMVVGGGNTFRRKFVETSFFFLHGLQSALCRDWQVAGWFIFQDFVRMEISELL